MPDNALEARIARLMHEIEKLSLQHAEVTSRRSSSASPRIRELDAKRAEILARRLRELGEKLDDLQKGKAS